MQIDKKTKKTIIKSLLGMSNDEISTLQELMRNVSTETRTSSTRIKNKDAVKRIFKNNLNIEDGEEQVIFPLFEKGLINKNEIEITWSEAVYNIIPVINRYIFLLKATSVYTIDLFFILFGDENVDEISSIEIPIEDIRKELGCENKYSRISGLRERILDPAINELENTLGKSIKSIYNRKGNKVESIFFNIK